MMFSRGSSHGISVVFVALEDRRTPNLEHETTENTTQGKKTPKNQSQASARRQRDISSFGNVQ